MSEESSEGGPWFTLGAVMGAAVGLMVGLIAVPRSGGDARRAPVAPSEAWRLATERADVVEPDPDSRG